MVDFSSARRKWAGMTSVSALLHHLDQVNEEHFLRSKDKSRKNREYKTFDYLLGIGLLRSWHTVGVNLHEFTSDATAGDRHLQATDSAKEDRNRYKKNLHGRRKCIRDWETV